MARLTLRWSRSAIGAWASIRPETRRSGPVFEYRHVIPVRMAGSMATSFKSPIQPVLTCTGPRHRHQRKQTVAPASSGTRWRHALLNCSGKPTLLIASMLQMFKPYLCHEVRWARCPSPLIAVESRARNSTGLREGTSVQRVMIIGQPGAGKSTLARKLGERTGLPVVHHVDLD